MEGQTSKGRSVFKSDTGKEPSQAVESVTFSFMTDEDVLNHSVVKVTDPKLMDENGVPTPNGLYDPKMGLVLRQTVTCQHCGQIGEDNCTGHPGHMEFDYPIYNPSTFDILCCILKRTCFYCHRFKEKKKVKKCVSQLKLITEGEGKQTWTSLQFVDASNVMDKALKSQLSKKCEWCRKESPKLEKLAFGWILMADGTNQKERDENFKLGLLVDKDSRDLSPIKVKELLKDLWENEKEFCSYIGDLCRSGSERNDYSMFFLESLLVPPPKFRPPIQKGYSFQDHPQTLGLSKVLQSSITLGDALSEKLDSSQIINRWMDLQKSVNVLFKSKNATVQGKKQGLFRQNMMGKQVNYVCKSVISRDPYIPLNEIGIPLIIAKKLTYPERVTGCNLDKLKKALINGPDIYPGATLYRSNGFLGDSRSGTQLARKLLSRLENNQIVHRHMQDGDVVLVNHQPALHKPSITAHIVRVMKGEETIRMHYANCSTYNADFDGDVIVHFPQDEISRAEAYNIVNANNQYARPSNGGPLRSLIEDHIVSSVLLTKRDTFLDKDEFCQLLFSSGVTDTVLGSFSGRSGKKKVMVSASDAEPLIVTPAILKPVPLWTGKQVITAVLNQITKGHPPLTVEKATKLPVDFFNCRSREVKLESGESNIDESWKRNLNEDKLLIRKNEFVCGVIDKAQFADYGLVHTVHELCGSNAAGNLLSVLSRLFTVFLQIHGFTCGVDDLIILEDMAEKGKKQLQECEQVGERVLRKIFGIDVDVQIDTKDMISRIQKHNDRESALAYLDRSTANELNQCSNKGVMNDFLSDGLLKTPGKNCMSLMTLSGAKGSKVNFQQISSHLGQQDIAGERVPRMVSGKTLPCFHPWDWSPRAGGFISDSFLSGLRPQEYYFHCMAGRERLVDTEVKISDSGYLQRCLIKNLESLKVNYDCTVRDADGSIIQFQYGEDGVDVHQSSFIGKVKELTLNQDLILHRYSEDMLSGSSSYITDLPSTLKTGAEKFIEAMPVNEASKLERHEELLKLVKLKFFASLAQPGEPVGVLAGQSVGESSTRMTLNTFHLAGSGEMNVTLGIPRLQEILMTDTKTPIMTCPLLKGKTNDDANVIADKLRKITVADIIASVEVKINPQTVHESEVCCIYKLKMNLHNPEPYLRHTDVTDEYLNETITVLFLGKLEDAIEAHMKMLYRTRWGTGSEAGNETDNNDAVIGNDPADDEGEGREADDGMDYEENSEDNEDENAEVGEEEIPEPQQEEEMPEPQQEEEMPEPQQEEEMPEPQQEEEMPEPQQEEEIPEPQQEEEMPELMEDRIIFSHRGDNSFEVHFKFPIEVPRILIDEIALKTAKEVYIQKPGKIERCRVVNCGDPQVIYHGENPKERKEISYDEKKASPALYVSGVDSPMMSTIMLKFKDTLDVRYMYSNSIHNMLNTFGVEAARETILRELNDVFKSCGISVSIRHLNLIADYMTVSGRYRPFKGGIAGSTSPFCRMTCETATKFLVQAATYGEKDTLETPSARICLGLPVRSGTGCFDLMERVEL